MPSLYRPESCTEDVDPSRGAEADANDGTNLYLTNEVFLYRVIGMAADEPDEIVELEDCYSLQVAFVPLRELRARRLRVVRPAPTSGP